jgi:hypothetical protein
MRSGIFRHISNPLHIVVTLVLMVVVMAAGLWWVK